MFKRNKLLSGFTTEYLLHLDCMLKKKGSKGTCCGQGDGVIVVSGLYAEEKMCKRKMLLSGFTTE